MNYLAAIGGAWWQLAAVVIGIVVVGAILFFFVRRTKGDVAEEDNEEKESEEQAHQAPLHIPSFAETITLPSRNKTVDVGWMRSDSHVDAVAVPSSGTGRIVFAIAALIVGILLLGSGGFFVWKSDVVRQEEHKESIVTLAQPAEPVTQSQAQADDIPQEEIPSAPSDAQQQLPQTAPQDTSSKQDPSTVRVTVLNGGAAVGSASVVKNLLVEKGYGKTDAANAKSTYTGEVIYYKNGFAVSAKEIATILSASYPKASVRMDDAMAQAGGADVVVILGTPTT